MGTYTILTKNGVADADQKEALDRLASELAKKGAKVLLHLHGGLVDQASGKAAAERLSGAGQNSWQLGNDWTQIYVVWRTGALETIKTNWQDLVHDDRLYQTVVKKLIDFVARRLGVPDSTARGPGSLAMDEADILRRLTGKAGPRPFDRIDTEISIEKPSGQRATLMGERSDGELALDFEAELNDDEAFQRAASDIDEAINVPSGARGPSLGADQATGEEMRKRLDANIKRELEPPVISGTEARGIVSAAGFLLKHAGKAGLRCFKRFRNGRDHGLHATIVEEVCREFYGDLIGAKVWGMMVQDAADHFASPGLGSALVDILKETPPATFVVTAHSAGSIWATHLLRAMKANKMAPSVKLFLLAPAVRTDVFAAMLDSAGDMITRCRMITMTDELERRDAVLGHDKSYIYPSSLLYLVSGMFEEKEAQAYVDAPLLGMQRFTTSAGLAEAEVDAAKRITSFFQQADHGIISSPTPGVSVADSHGAFDDEPLTLATVRSLF
ncbi:alpha/beta hydrolase [Agrobacterium pusense]|uniref:alpha/beta hydrolase n=1 Tax=Agrobacterium pusense TaxID=648995 RepID=UPI001C6EC400|nr:alpha/beta hydrolase [Agrobacterium pusense]MBW9069845.1 alpha/beta hydrolase [Agrobacterium pusense]MBW9084916.1 alpha/beta hydrolase [Agrobacterium pusense]MBW9125609.1 alpha/beta hydrolase [Agrobacterium pusense]MBW9138024.1 alpha/beta hydrolase [Agrobacterium pusense]